jgi:O-antigen/teichoic acid export membrane protein
LQKIFNNFKQSEIVKASYFMAILSAVRLGVNVLIGKFLAIWLGTSGLYFFGQLQSVMLVVQNLSTGAIHNGVIKFWAAREVNKNENSLRQTIVSITLVFSTILSIILLLLGGIISQFFFNNDAFALSIRLLGLGTIGIGLNQLLLSVFNAELRFKAVSVFNNIQSVFMALLVIGGAYQFGVQGALIGLSLSQLGTFLAIALVFRNDLLRLLKKPFYRIDKLMATQLGRFSMMAIASTVSVAASQIIARNIMSSNLSESAAGLWEATTRISNIYIFFLSFLFTGYFLPRFSVKQGQSEIKNELKKGLLYISALFVLIALTLLPLRNWLIGLIFTEEFLMISTILALQLLGDYLKATSWLFTNYLAALNHTVGFIIFEIASQVTFLIFLHFALIDWGFEGIFYAYIGAWILQNLALFSYFYLVLIPKKT